MATRQTYEEFLRTIRPEQLGADGRFLGPQSGTNYQAEGLTPQDYYNLRINDRRDTGRFQGYGDDMSAVMEDVGSVNADWVAGPRNNGMWGSLTDGLNQMVNDKKFQAGVAAVVGAGAMNGFGAGELAGAGSTAGGGSLGAGADFGMGTYGAGLGGETAALSGSQIAALSPAASGGGFSFATPEIMTAGTGVDLGAIGTTAIPGEAASLGFSGIGGGTGGSAGIGSGTVLGGGGASASGSGGLGGIWDTASNYISNPSNLLRIGGTLLGAAGGAAASGDQTTSTSSNRDPWAPAQPYLLDNLKTNAAMQEHYRANPFSQLQQQQYQGLFSTLANNQANSAGLLANASNFGQSNRGRMPAMQGLISGTQAPAINWSEYANIGRR